MMRVKPAMLASILLLLLYLAIFFWKDFLAFPELYQDEHHYWATAKSFSGSVIPSLNLLKNYAQLNTPLPFLLGGWLIHFFGEEIQHLRIMNFLLSFLLLMGFVWYKPAMRKHWGCLVPMMAMPSFYLCSIHYYTDVLAWATVLAGFIAYLEKRHVWGMLFFIAAIGTRQYMLAFPLAIVLHEAIVRIGRDWKFPGRWWQKLTERRIWIYYAAAVASLVPWIVLWGGLAPAQMMKAQYYGSAPVYNVGFVIYVSACLGFYFVIPEMVLLKKWNYYLNFPKTRPGTLAALCFAVGLLILIFPPKQTYNAYFTWPYLGYLEQLLVTLGITGWVKTGVFAVLAILALMRFANASGMSVVGFMVIVNVLLLGKAQLSWDKYIVPVLLVLWFDAMHKGSSRAGTGRSAGVKDDAFSSVGAA